MEYFHCAEKFLQCCFFIIIICFIFNRTIYVDLLESPVRNTDQKPWRKLSSG